jgi:hypothetical protein
MAALQRLSLTKGRLMGSLRARESAYFQLRAYTHRVRSYEENSGTEIICPYVTVSAILGM